MYGVARLADRRLLGIGAVLLWIAAAAIAIGTDRTNDDIQLLIVGGAVTLTILWYLSRHAKPDPQWREYGDAMFQLGQFTGTTAPVTAPQGVEPADQPPPELLHALRSSTRAPQAVKLTIDDIPVIVGVRGGIVHTPEEETVAWRAIQHAVRQGNVNANGSGSAS